MNSAMNVETGRSVPDTGEIARGAAGVLERVREIRASDLAPILTSADPAAAPLARSLSTAERHALISQRHCVESLTARLRLDDDEVRRLGGLAASELEVARAALAEVTSVPAPETVRSSQAQVDESAITFEEETADSEVEAEAVAHLSDAPTWAADPMPQADERARRAERMRRPKPEPETVEPTDELIESAQEVPTDHEPVSPRSQTVVVEEDAAARDSLAAAEEPEIVLTASERADRSRRNRRIVTLLLVAIVIIGAVLLLSGSALFS